MATESGEGVGLVWIGAIAALLAALVRRRDGHRRARFHSRIIGCPRRASCGSGATTATWRAPARRRWWSRRSFSARHWRKRSAYAGSQIGDPADDGGDTDADS